MIIRSLPKTRKVPRDNDFNSIKKSPAPGTTIFIALALIIVAWPAEISYLWTIVQWNLFGMLCH